MLYFIYSFIYRRGRFKGFLDSIAQRDDRKQDEHRGENMQQMPLGLPDKP